jgi:hypothetical protein
MLLRAGILLASVVGLSADSVTLGVTQYVNANRMQAVVFTGTVSSRSSDEVVDVLARDCGARGERLVASARSGPGGGWRVETLISQGPLWFSSGVFSGTTFRARWKDDYSAPVVWRVPPAMQVARISGTRKWVVHVFPATPTGAVGLKGKRVELQRLAPSGWVRVRSATLTRKASLRWGAFNHQATFTVPTRKLRLRAFLPAASAAPCYLPGGTAPWRS